MNNKYFTTIIIVLGLILLGIFTAWLLVSRGYIELDSSNPPDTTNPEPIFPTNNDNSGVSNGDNETDPINSSNATSSIILSGGQLDKLLSKLDTRPVGGLVAVGQGTSTILFFERATGHLFQVSPEASPFRIANTTIPKVISALGGLQGSTTNFVIRSHNDRLETSLATLTNSATSSGSLFLGTEEEIGGSTQTLSIKPTVTSDFAVSPLENQIAYLESNSQQTSLIVADWSNTKREKVTSLPLAQVGLAWPASTTIALQTKASYTSEGLLYFYNLKTKKLDKIMGGVKGLSTKVSPDARYVLYSGSSNNSFFAALYDRRTGKVDRLPFKTLAEKCVWTRQSDVVYCGAPASVPGGNYPDNWYQGLSSFDDNLWELEVSTKKATLLFNPELNNLGETIDATHLTFDEINQQLYFVNKKDFSLWRLALGAGF